MATCTPIENAREQLKREAIEREIDTIKRTLEDKRKYMKTLLHECEDLQDELRKLKIESLSFHNLIGRYFKILDLCGLDRDSFYYIIKIDNDGFIKTLRIVIDKSCKNDTYQIEVLKIHPNFFSEEDCNLLEITSDDFLEVYHKAIDSFNLILKEVK